MVGAHPFVAAIRGDREPAESYGGRSVVGANKPCARTPGEIRCVASDAVLVHGDLGAYNLAVNPATGEVQGVFDYGDAVFGDRHQDFKYLQFYGPEEQVMLDAAIKAYEGATRIILDRGRIRFFNAIGAIGFLGSRLGHAPEERWCGRTLDEDVEWTTTALEAAGF